MKKFFQAFGMIVFICFSFFYTSKASHLIRESDTLMIAIKEVSNQYSISPIEPMIEGNKMIPGYVGQTLNISKSYQEMKRYGSFYEPLLQLEPAYPQKRALKTYDKFVISGNPKKKMVSLIFLLDDHDNPDTILNILKTKNVKGNFFLDGSYMESHNEMVSILAEGGHVLGNLSYNQDYSSSAFTWMDTIIKKVAHQKQGYCYAETESTTVTDYCRLQKNITIMPQMIVKENPYYAVKNHLTAGSLISFKLTKTLEQELPVILEYIESRGYSITTLTEHLQE